MAGYSIRGEGLRRHGLAIVIFTALAVLVGSRAIGSFVLEFEWWREMGQLDTWVQLVFYNSVPMLVAALAAIATLWVAHATALQTAGTGLEHHPWYTRLSTLLVVGGGILLSLLTVDSWTAARYIGGAGATGGWRDPAFGQDLAFYFFRLPFYTMLLRYLLALAITAALLHWFTGRAWLVRREITTWGEPGGMQMDLSDLDPRGALNAMVVRSAAIIFLLALAVRFFLGRYELVFSDHSSLVGVDWVAEHVNIPMQWVKIGAALLAAAGIAAGKPQGLLLLVAAVVSGWVLPPAVHALYVRPSEITIQQPYIKQHIAATRSAYALDKRTREIEYKAEPEPKIDAVKHAALLQNVRLWDWQAFHDTVTQIQALRPYYVFPDSDPDRYVIEGQLRQVLVAPRELDVRQLSGEARSRWINPHFIYTHGYGLVLSESARTTPDGLPVLLIQDAPPRVSTPSLKITRPEIYYGESAHEPVFVRTQQPEFNYPAGSTNVENHYDGQGGFRIAPMLTRLAAAAATSDWNILLTSYLTPESRIMIRRNVRERIDALAGFVYWDNDPYLVVTQSGRLVWMLDGFTASDAHPFSRHYGVPGLGRINYIRNSVKATLDAYDGTVHLYVFDDTDPLLKAYRKLFPKLFEEKAAMPPDLRAHARYPELLFGVQAEAYRLYHMTNPEAFFNREDLWDQARTLTGVAGRPSAAEPNYLIATPPGSTKPEFLLVTNFTPRGKDNLLGIMMARCDGDSLGELVFLQLSKQQLIYGPMQIDARVNQDKTISKDLTLWNQQGSQVLRGQMMILPVDNSLLYIEPVYLQASEARMPEMKKIVLATASRLIYTDTYAEAISELTGSAPSVIQPGSEERANAAQQPTTAPGAERQLDEVRVRLGRYRELLGQGKYAEAGRELEAVEKLLNK